MTWAKLDDTVYSHPKMLALPLEALGLWAMALAWSSCHLTDGFLPTDAVVSLSSPRAGESIEDARAKYESNISQLVDNRLWEVVEGGWRIHNYARYQPTRAQVKTRREARAEAGKLGGKASGRTRKAAAKARNRSKGEASASSPKQSASVCFDNVEPPTRPVKRANPYRVSSLDNACEASASIDSNGSLASPPDGGSLASGEAGMGGDWTLDDVTLERHARGVADARSALRRSLVKPVEDPNDGEPF